MEELRWLVMLFASPEICGLTLARDALDRVASIALRSGFPVMASQIYEFLDDPD